MSRVLSRVLSTVGELLLQDLPDHVHTGGGRAAGLLADGHGLTLLLAGDYLATTYYLVTAYLLEDGHCHGLALLQREVLVELLL